MTQYKLITIPPTDPVKLETEFITGLKSVFEYLYNTPKSVPKLKSRLERQMADLKSRKANEAKDGMPDNLLFNETNYSLRIVYEYEDVVSKISFEKWARRDDRRTQVLDDQWILDESKKLLSMQSELRKITKPGVTSSEYIGPIEAAFYAKEASRLLVDVDSKERHPEIDFEAVNHSLSFLTPVQAQMERLKSCKKGDVLSVQDSLAQSCRKSIAVLHPRQRLLLGNEDAGKKVPALKYAAVAPDHYYLAGIRAILPSTGITSTAYKASLKKFFNNLLSLLDKTVTYKKISQDKRAATGYKYEVNGNLVVLNMMSQFLTFLKGEQETLPVWEMVGLSSSSMKAIAKYQFRLLNYFSKSKAQCRSSSPLQTEMSRLSLCRLADAKRTPFSVLLLESSSDVVPQEDLESALGSSFLLQTIYRHPNKAWGQSGRVKYESHCAFQIESALSDKTSTKQLRPHRDSQSQLGNLTGRQGGRRGVQINTQPMLSSFRSTRPAQVMEAPLQTKTFDEEWLELFGDPVVADPVQIQEEYRENDPSVFPVCDEWDEQDHPQVRGLKHHHSRSVHIVRKQGSPDIDGQFSQFV